MFDNPTDNHTDIEVPLYYKLRFTKLKNDMNDTLSNFILLENKSKVSQTNLVSSHL